MKQHAEPVSWKITKNAILVDDGLRKRPWVFDSVLSPSSANEAVYVNVARPIVRRALRGFNGTVFCYGQTGSGKTYSMLGDGPNRGMLPRAVIEVFHEVDMERNRSRRMAKRAADADAALARGDNPDRIGLAAWDEHEYLVRVSYLEVYNEEVNDLLQDARNGVGINLRILRDDPVKGAVVEGLTEKVCRD